MNMRVAKEEMAIMMPTTLSHYTNETYYPAETAAPRPTLLQRAASMVAWLSELPHRRAVMNELSSLTDHELADIGLSRSELPRVFEPDFVAQRNTRLSLSTTGPLPTMTF